MRRLWLTALLLATSSPALAFDHDHALWNDVLEIHARNSFVDYAGLKKAPRPLDSYLAELEAVSQSEFSSWNREQKLAFWINAYNALTLKTVIDHYPLKPTFPGYFWYPDNSIRQIPLAFTFRRHRVLGRKTSLNDIEHKILRRRFSEPRIHMALVCASKGCPPLRGEPYTGDKLNVQLDDQSRAFLRNPTKFRIDRDNGRIYLSAIFKWFGEDFVEAYGAHASFSYHSRAKQAVLNFIGGYIDAKDAEALRMSTWSIKYLDYDWSLNEKPLEPAAPVSLVKGKITAKR